MDNDDRIIKVLEPKRDWLLHCEGDDNQVFTLCVCDGTIEILGPDHKDTLLLERSQIAEFRQALDEAIDVAEADLRAQRA